MAPTPTGDMHAVEDLDPLRCRAEWTERMTPAATVWRFRVPDGETIRSTDEVRGPQAFTADGDFGDFVVWRKGDVPCWSWRSRAHPTH